MPSSSGGATTLRRFELVVARLERGDARFELPVALRERLRVPDHETVLFRQVENRALDEVEALVRSVEPKVSVFAKIVHLRTNATNLIPNVFQDLDCDIAASHRHLLSG